MDSDNASATPLAGKIRCCPCGRRMTSFNMIFIVCVGCRGIDCDTDYWFPECNDVSDVLMTNFVKHKISLQRKLQSRRKLKESVSAPAIAADAVDVANRDVPDIRLSGLVFTIRYPA